MASIQISDLQTSEMQEISVTESTAIYGGDIKSQVISFLVAKILEYLWEKITSSGDGGGGGSGGGNDDLYGGA